MGGNKHWICETMDEKGARELAEEGRNGQDVSSL